jgi:hypothetical protein
MKDEVSLMITSEKRHQDQDILSFVEKLDFLDIQILRKFYMTGKDFPNDTQPYCFPVLFKEMKETQHLKIGLEALRKRLDSLVKHGFLEKVKKSNPTNYTPLKGKEKKVKMIIMKFFVIHGITKFL